MKMINDMDIYYANEYARANKPSWMKAERMDFCETDAKHRRTSFLGILFQKKTK